MHWMHVGWPLFFFKKSGRILYKSDEGFIKPFGVGLRSLLVDKTEAD